MAPQTVFGVTFDFEALTGQQKILIGAAVAALVVGLGIYLGKPTYDQWQEAIGRVEKLAEEKESKERKIAKIPELKQKYASLQAELKSVEDKLPREENVPSLLFDIEKLGREAVTLEGNVWLDKFVPGNLTDLTLPSHLKDAAGATQSVKQLPMDLIVRGPFPSFIGLLQSFEGYERTLATNSMTLEPIRTEKGDPRIVPIKVTMNMNAFVLLEKGGP